MFYKDYFSVKEDYAPCMTKDAINRNPKTWMHFYPHKTFVDFLKNILERLNGGNQSVWLTGAYGTGKSHVALVLQKLFMDDESRVNEWLEKRDKLIPANICQELKVQRANKVLAVFDTGSTGINTPNQFLVRIERAIMNSLEIEGYRIPAMGSLDEIVARVHREGAFFFEKRDDIQGKLSFLTSEIKNAATLEKKIKDHNLTAGLVNDTMVVLQSMDIYINLSTENLIKWVYNILDENKISKLLFIWDEFSSYIDKNASELKTFEEIAEASQEGRFFFVPVTHMEITAYLAAGSESAKKANDRFKFKALDMPTNTALLLAADAFKVQKIEEWQKEKDLLWYGVKGVVENYMIPKNCDANADDFKGILPVHPMAAFVLKFLSTAVGSNQRSMFNFLKGDIGDSEFQKFIAHGGPEVSGLQYLTVDYLWSYFIERDDLGTGRDVFETRAEYSRKSATLDENEKRVLKAVLLYSLLGRLAVGGHDLIQPTIENIVRCFEGDGVLIGVDTIIQELAKKHCFSIVNGRCEMFRSSVGGEELQKKIMQIDPQFNGLVLGDKTKPKLESKVRSFKDKRYEVCVSTVEKCNHGSIKNKEWFSSEGNKVLLQFILARDPQEQLQIPDKAKSLASHFKDHRIIFLAMPELTFCDGDANRWIEYVEQCARKELASDQGSRTLHTNQLTLIENDWLAKVINPMQKIKAYKPNVNGLPFTDDLTWGQMEAYLHDFIKETLSCFVDEFSGYNSTAFGPPNSLQKWAQAGMLDSNIVQPGAWKSVLTAFERAGITGSPDWFEQNPNHALTQMRDLCKRKLENTVGRGETCSIRKIYIELQRAPYGLLGIPYSAFVLGFVLKEWLSSSRQLQWTNGSLSKKLDADILSEIIEAVVKDDGHNLIKNEKLICRLSKEEKTFVEQSSTIFGLPYNPNGTVENTLKDIAERLEKISGRVPLWVLPDYIKSKNEVYADVLCEIIDSLCIANTISAKGDTEERTTRIKSVGAKLLETEGLADIFARYIKPDIFADAFRMYVDVSNPELRELALNVGDNSYQYCLIVKNQFVASTGWLWNRQNVEAELNTVSLQYKIIRAVQSITGNSGYMPFESALERVKRVMISDNKISLDIIIGNYPMLNRFVQILISAKIGEGLKDLTEIFTHQADVLKKLFFDPAQKEQINILKTLFSDALASQSDGELKKLYDTLSSGASRTEDDFKKQAWTEIENYLKTSIAQQVVSLWQAKTGTDSPNLWSNQYGIPVEVLFGESPQARSIMEVVSNPSAFTPERLKQTKKSLEKGAITVSLDDKEEPAKRFLLRALPKRYQKLGIDAKELSGALMNQIGNNPNDWLSSPKFGEEVEKFIRDRYQTQYKAKAVDKVKSLSEANAKKMLLKFVETIPDVGLNILE